MKSNVSHQFNIAQRENTQRSSFDRSHGHKTTVQGTYLYPIFIDEVLPGDTFNLKLTALIRMASQLKWPVMDNIFAETFFFFVPNRLVHTNFKKLMGETDTAAAQLTEPAYSVPQIWTGLIGCGIGSLGDHFGIPVGVPNLAVCAYPFRMYNLIHREWFNTQQLVDPVTVNLGDADENMTSYTLLKRHKRHDYFTACMPQTQAGPTVRIPLGDTAPVWGDGTTLAMSDGSSLFSPMTTFGEYKLDMDYGGAGSNVGDAGDKDAGTSTKRVGVITSDEGEDAEISSGLYADLAETNAVTINSLRLTIQLQKFYEKCMRGGRRYTEMIKMHFGVTSPDFRLQRPEYLGGSVQRINVHPVMQTSDNVIAGVAEQATGRLGAYAVGLHKGSGFVKSFTEHGMVVGLLNIRADLTYQNGLERFWSRLTRLDYYWPSFAHIGEQGVLNKEIFAQGDDVVDEDDQIVDSKVFGYQEYGADYRYKPSKITGEFRSYAAPGFLFSGTLDSWHLSQRFEELPLLNQDFIEEDPPFERVVALSNGPHFIVDMWYSYKCARAMPLYSTPGLMDHF